MTGPEKPEQEDREQLLDTLLDSMVDDAPRPEARRAAAVALGLGTAVATAAASTSAGASVGVILTKALSVGVLAGMVTVGAVAGLARPDVFSASLRTSAGSVQTQSESATQTTQAKRQAPAPPPLTYALPAPTAATESSLPTGGASIARPLSPTPSPSPSPSLSPPSYRSRHDEDGAAVVKIPPPRSAKETTTPPQSAPSRLSLRDETAALERASAALARGDLARGFAEIDAYERAFPSGVLEPEALFLRIDGLVRARDLERAQEAADAFRSRYPQSPHLARIRSLISRDQTVPLVP